MRTGVGIVAVTCVLLAGCSGGDGGNDGGNDGGGKTSDGKAGGVLAGLDGDTLCGLVDDDTIEAQFHEPIANDLGGTNPPEQRGSVVCDYVSKAYTEADIDDLGKQLMVTAKVTQAHDGANNAKGALDAYLVDFDGETVAYEEVDGLGEAAGYAGATLSVGSGGAAHLAAIITVDDTLVEVVTKVEPDGTLDQLRPIEEKLISGVQSTLG